VLSATRYDASRLEPFSGVLARSGSDADGGDLEDCLIDCAVRVRDDQHRALAAGELLTDLADRPRLAGPWRAPDEGRVAAERAGDRICLARVHAVDGDEFRLSVRGGFAE
jgi:hypothetical protein